MNVEARRYSVDISQRWVQAPESAVSSSTNTSGALFEQLEPRLLLSGAVAGVTASLGEFRFVAGDGIPAVHETFTAHISGQQPDRVVFELAGQSPVTDTNPGDGWRAVFDMSALDQETDLTVRAFEGAVEVGLYDYDIDMILLPGWMSDSEVRWSCSNVSPSSGYTFDVYVEAVDWTFAMPDEFVWYLPHLTTPVLDLRGKRTGLEIGALFQLQSMPNGDVQAHHTALRTQLIVLDNVVWEKKLSGEIASGDLGASIYEDTYELDIYDDHTEGYVKHKHLADVDGDFTVQFAPFFNTDMTYSDFGVVGDFHLGVTSARIPIVKIIVPVAQVPGLLDLKFGLDFQAELNLDGRVELAFGPSGPRVVSGCLTLGVGVTLFGYGQGELLGGSLAKAGLEISGTLEQDISLCIVSNAWVADAPGSFCLSGKLYWDYVWRNENTDPGELNLFDWCTTWNFVSSDPLPGPPPGQEDLPYTPPDVNTTTPLSSDPANPTPVGDSFLIESTASHEFPLVRYGYQIDKWHNGSWDTIEFTYDGDPAIVVDSLADGLYRIRTLAVTSLTSVGYSDWGYTLVGSLSRPGDHLEIIELEWTDIPGKSDGDSMPEAGEQIRLKASVRNASGVDVGGVDLTVRSANQDIEFLDDSIPIGYLDHREVSGISTYGAKFDITYPHTLTDVPFIIRAEYVSQGDGLDYYQEFPVILKTFYADGELEPDFELSFRIEDVAATADFNNNDEIFQSGEFVKLYPTLTNTGDGIAHDINVVVFALGSPVEIIGEGVRFPDLEPGQSAPSLNNDYIYVRSTSDTLAYTGPVLSDVRVEWGDEGSMHLEDELRLDILPAPILFSYPSQTYLGVQPPGDIETTLQLRNYGSGPMTITGFSFTDGTTGSPVSDTSVELVMPGGARQPFPSELTLSGQEQQDIVVTIDASAIPMGTRIERVVEVVSPDGRTMDVGQDDRSIISTLVDVPSPVGRIQTEYSARQPDVGGDWAVYSDSRNGNEDVFAYNLQTGQEIQVTNEPYKQNLPMVHATVDGAVVVWEDWRNVTDPSASSYELNVDVYAYYTATGQTFPVATAPQRDVLLGMNDSGVFLARPYAIEEADPGDYRAFWDLHLHAVDGASGSVTSQANVSGYGPAGGNGMSVIDAPWSVAATTDQAVAWMAEFKEVQSGHWSGEDAGIWRASCTNPASPGSPVKIINTPSQYLVNEIAARGSAVVFTAEGTCEEDQLWEWTPPIRELTSDCDRKGSWYLAGGGQYVVMDWSGHSGIYYWDNNGNPRLLTNGPAITGGNVAMDGDTVVWLSNVDGREQVHYAFIGAANVAIGPEDIVPSDPQPDEEDTISVTATVHNTSEVDVTDIVTVELYPSDPAGGADPIGEEEIIGGISALGQASVVFGNVVVPANDNHEAQQERMLWVKISRPGDIPTDNKAATSILVHDDDTQGPFINSVSIRAEDRDDDKLFDLNRLGISWSVSDASGPIDVTVEVDDEIVHEGEGSASVVIDPLSAGTHILEIIATDSDESPESSVYVEELVIEQDDPPTIESLMGVPGTVTQGQTLVLVAENVADGGGVKEVAFYRDENGNGVGEAGELLGIDGSESDGWSWTEEMVTWPLGPHTCLARATDDGTPGQTSTWASTTITVRPDNPTVTINQASGQADPTSSSPIHFTVVFSKSVSDFATGDVTLSGTAPGSLIGTVTGSGTTYNVAVSGMTGRGTVVATIAAGEAHDAAGNPNELATSTDNVVTYDPDAVVVGRHVFYNNSLFDGDTPGPNTGDDGAIDASKSALRPGGVATFENYTGYSRGLNGIMIDVADFPDDHTPTADDFLFRVGDHNDLLAWTGAPAAVSVTIRRGDGVDGSDRITIIWADNAIEDQWVEVTFLANDDTRLDLTDVFYFGNLVGNCGGSSTSAVVDEEDLSLISDVFGQPGSPSTQEDVNHDGTVDLVDLMTASANFESYMKLPFRGNDQPANVDLSNDTIPENEPIGTVIGTLSTADADIGDTHAYDWVSGEGDTGNTSFEIDGDVLSTAAVFDYETQEIYSIRVRSTDQGGLYRDEVFEITVTDVNDAPVAHDDGGTGFVTDEDTAFLTGNILENDTDQDTSDVLSVSSIDTTGTLGLVTDNGDGTFRYDPNGTLEWLAVGQTATDTFQYTANDGNGGTDTATVTVTVEGRNDAPVAEDDTATTDEDTPVTVPAPAVLGNDSDPDGDPLTVSSADTASAQGGIVTVNTDGSFTYDPDGQFEYLAVNETDTDTFSYIISDGNGGTDTGLVTVTIDGRNDTPIANVETPEVNEDGPAITIDLTGNDKDPDASDDLEILDVDTTGTLGTVVINPDNDSVTYDPDEQFESLAVGEVTTDRFGYTVNDGHGGTAAATVTITILGVNDPPVAAGQSFDVNEDGSYAGVLTAADVDASDTLTYAVLTGPFHGTISNIDLETGAFTYEPDLNYNGTDTFTFTASDGQADSNEATVAITVHPVNDAPSFASGGDVDCNENAGPQEILSWATDISPGPVDEATQWVGFTVTNDSNALFSVQPAVSPDGMLTFTPTENANGTAEVTIQAYDNGGTANGGQNTSTIETFTITVHPINDAPSFVGGGDVDCHEDAGPQTIPGWATDISSGPTDETTQSVAFDVTNDNNALFSTQPEISPDGILTFTPSAGMHGSAVVTVQAHDDGGIANGGQDTSSPQQFTISVNPIDVELRIDLRTDVGGQPGELILDDTVFIEQSFFVIITAADVRLDTDPLGLVGLSVNLDWEAGLLDEIDDPFDPPSLESWLICEEFEMFRGGRLDQADGYVENLTGGSLPAGEEGEAIGIGGYDIFSVMHFQAEDQVATDMPLELTLGYYGISLADRAEDVTVVIEDQTLTILAAPKIGVADSSGADDDAAIQFMTPRSAYNPGAADSMLVRPTCPDVDQWIEVTNTGSAPLTLFEIQINAPDVSVDVSLDSIVLDVGEAQQIHLTYAPTLPTPDNATCQDFDLIDGLVILSDAVNEPTLNVALEGHSTFRSDISYDGRVNLGELGVLNANFGRKLGDANFDPTADIYYDGVVNLGDLGLLNREFGRERPSAISAGLGTSPQTTLQRTQEMGSIAPPTSYRMPSTEAEASAAPILRETTMEDEARAYAAYVAIIPGSPVSGEIVSPNDSIITENATANLRADDPEDAVLSSSTIAETAETSVPPEAVYYTTFPEDPAEDDSIDGMVDSLDYQSEFSSSVLEEADPAISVARTP